MKNFLLIVLAIMLSIHADAQSGASNGKVALKMIENLTYGVTNLETMPSDKWSQVKDCVGQALADVQTASHYKTWEWKMKVCTFERVQMLKEYQANGNQFRDMKAFFENEAQIVAASERYYELLNARNANGQYPVSDQVRATNVEWARMVGIASRGNLYVGATQYVYSEPKTAVKLLDAYFASYDHPLFKNPSEKPLDDAFFVYATALKDSGADAAKVEKYLLKSLTSSNGALACQDLITLYRERGDEANELKYLRYAVEHYPQIAVFGINLAQCYINNRQYDEAVAVCDQLIQRERSGLISVDENGRLPENMWYIYYFKAVSLFNTEKFMQAYEAFMAGDKRYPGHIEMVMGAGTSAAKYGNNHYADKAVCTPWFEKAIVYLLKAEQQWPDASDQWGYQLYACYHNLGNKAMEEKYKKYTR